MARDPFLPKIYPAWDRQEDIEDYRRRRDEDNLRTLCSRCHSKRGGH